MNNVVKRKVRLLLKVQYGEDKGSRRFWPSTS